MAARSLLIVALLATSAIASPPGYGDKTVTVTKHKTKTEKYTTTKTKRITHTVTESTTCSATLSSMYSMTSTTPCSCPTMPTMVCPTGMSSSVVYSNSTPSMPMTTSSASSMTNPTTTIIATATATGYGLNDAAKAAGKLWAGTAADIPGTGEASDPYYIEEFDNVHDFGEATPANIMKWFSVEPEQDVFNFTGGDYFLDVAKAAGKQVRCHNLVWKSQLPAWITSPATPWTNATLLAAMRNHITKTVAHFGDRCYSWDVVNEAFADNPAGAFDNSSIFFDVIGEEYLYQAFDAAQKAVADNGLSVKLYYNDYNIETIGAKSDAARAAVTEMHDRGIQIDGVGLESHFIAGSTPSLADQQANMEAFTALDVDVVVTELDVRLNLPPTAATEAQQKLDYYNTAAACVAVERCVGLVVWDFDDTYSWIPSTFAGQGYGDLFLQPEGANTPLVKKAAYDGLLEAFMGVPEVPV